ncbi:claudin-20-like [Carcharodon carcharias]|uniref:claudin-20-like n=1 Tax=Carcharodon carcharias TaxID=13397 RepID=UPI001B7DD56B|nr:claudin-20-like [Carcharodon carcharias]
MASAGLQIFAFSLFLFAFLGVIATTGLPNWKVNTFAESNVISTTTYMKGLWMECTWYSTGVFSCRFNFSILAQPVYIQVSQAMMVLSCLTSMLGIGISLPGMKCIRWGGDQRTKRCAAITGGVCFITAGIMCLVSLFWFTTELVSHYFKQSVSEDNRYEIGGAIYLGCISAGFSFIAGAIFCTSCNRELQRENVQLSNRQHYSMHQSLGHKADYSLQDYV